MPYKDPLVRSEYHKRYMKDRYESDPGFRERSRAATRATNQKRRQIGRALLEKAKEGGCVICNEQTSCCLDLHHVGKKTAPVASMLSQGFTVNQLAVEIKKCVVLCANCHRKLHAGLTKLSKK